VSLFLAPHNDDETLFGSFTILEHQPHVVVCFRSYKQEHLYGITAAARELETARAVWHLGTGWEQLHNPDHRPDLDKLVFDLGVLDHEHEPDVVWAPAVEEGGHEQHNMVGQVARALWGDRVRPYLTYRRGHMRSRGIEVPFQTNWVLRKLRALACYETQIGLTGDCQPWFMDDTLREYRP
jgi:LmbE family N-acetylglucosaminyl deacetylase